MVMTSIFKPPLSTLRRISNIPSSPRLSLAYELHQQDSSERTNAKAIIFMHGLFGSKKNNRGISRDLMRHLGRPVYAVDLRNHGDSPHHPQHDYLSMAEDLVGFITSHDLESPTLIGHSMGAKVAMVLALQFPSLINDIVSVDNVPAENKFPSDFSHYIEGMKKIEQAETIKQSVADEVLKKYVKSLTVRHFLLGNLYRSHEDPQRKKTLKFKLALDILRDSLDTLSGFPLGANNKLHFDKPALFIRGTKSNYVPDSVLPEIRRFFPRFELASIDAGHWVISENVEAFRQVVLKFLGRSNE